MNLNYQKICLDLIRDLTQRQRKIIERRFGLKTSQRETLESIGKDYGITRERIRQIVNRGIFKIKPKLKKYQKVFSYFKDQLKKSGDLKKEDILLSQLGSKKFQSQVFFLLTLADPFERFLETKDFYSLWTINPQSLQRAQKIINSLYNKFLEINQPLFFKDLHKEYENLLTKPALLAYLEISKKIYQGPEGQYGLRDWPEIKPRGVKDLAYLVLKKEGKPLHFQKVAEKIGKGALIQTVHNELIKDPRFVLVGRGTYALKEWGYQAGIVKEIIFKILKETKKPLTKKEILEKVLKQRLVKENTILQNLRDKKIFKDSQGKYFLKEV
jgi:hypothetical protein